MSWLALVFAMQAGMISQYNSILSPPVSNGASSSTELAKWTSPPNAFEISMDAKFILFDHIELKGSLKSYQIPLGSWVNFQPFEMTYGIGAAVHFGPFIVGIERQCSHTFQITGIDQSVNGAYNYAFTEGYLRFEHKFTF